LVGFADIVILEMRLRVREITVHESNGSRWVALPARPQIGRDGVARRDERGKIAHGPVLQFTDRETSNAFSARVLDVLLERFPHAFEEASQ
jgi:hypothetical protein